MGFKCGIVGLPNVGKSTLFNALTQTAAAQTANYPFCTIEPNSGDVPVPDPRLDEIATIANSAQIIPTRLTFVDIAGLVRGASKGEGLGNQFLGHIREMDAIAYVLRCFESEDITHVENRIDPLSDAEIVETELMLADLESLEKRRSNLEKKAKSHDKISMAQLDLIDRALVPLRQGQPARLVTITDEDDRKAFSALNLLTAKPVLYVCNVDEKSADTGNVFSRKVEDHVAREDATTVVISARIESELVQIPQDERRDYLDELGLTTSGFDKLTQASYKLLRLITFFTAGPRETRAWTIQQGTRAPQAAGTIHTDFERGFIRAQTISFDDYVKFGGENGAKEAGKARDEGKDYIVQDGDVILFKFAV